MTTITIPSTIGAAQTALASLGGLITAKEWERAAIVYAFTRDGEPGEGGPGREQLRSSEQLPISQFAAKGIAGLGSRNTIARYRQAWQKAIDAGLAREAHPGQVTELPSMAWAEAYTSERAERGRVGSIEIPVTSDAGMAEWFADNPEEGARVIRAALDAPPAARAAFADPHTRVQASDAIHAWHTQAERRLEASRSARDEEAGFIPLSENINLAVNGIRDLLVRFARMDEVTDRERGVLQRGCERLKPYVDFWAGEEDVTVTDEDLAAFLGSES